MVTRLRAGAKGDAKSLAPSSSAGREFYPNLFPPRVGDAVRVLWDQNQWYEAAAVEEPALDGAVQPASAYSSPPASACWAAFGWAPPPRGAAPPRLHVRYAIDGTRDALVWCACGVFFSRRVDGVAASTRLQHIASTPSGRARDYPRAGLTQTTRLFSWRHRARKVQIHWRLLDGGPRRVIDARRPRGTGGLC